MGLSPPETILVIRCFPARGERLEKGRSKHVQHEGHRCDIFAWSFFNKGTKLVPSFFINNRPRLPRHSHAPRADRR
jgi:hypothetical protein